MYIDIVILLVTEKQRGEIEKGEKNEQHPSSTSSPHASLLV